MKPQVKVWIVIGLLLSVFAFFAYKMAQDRKRATYAAATPAERGWMIMDDKGCISCHQMDSGFRAPSLKGLYGRTVKLHDGSEIVADAAYINESIVAPMTRVAAGYQPSMPNYMGRISAEEMADMIEAMKPDSAPAQ